MSSAKRSLASAVRRLSYANIASTLALFLALGTGTAYAANTIRSGDIVDGQVKRVDLAGGAVNGAKLKDGAVSATKLAAGSVSAAALQPAVVSSGSVLDESLTQVDLGTDSVGATEIADNTIDGGEIIDDSLGSNDLGPSSVGSSEVINNSLSTADLVGTDVNGATISIGAGAVANGRCKQFTVVIGGAKAGEAVVFSVKGAIQDGMLIYGQRVPSDDNVTMSVCNFTGGANNAITNLPVRVITFG